MDGDAVSGVSRARAVTHASALGDRRTGTGYTETEAISAQELFAFAN